jgi:hypothetical protein
MAVISVVAACDQSKASDSYLIGLGSTLRPKPASSSSLPDQAQHIKQVAVQVLHFGLQVAYIWKECGVGSMGRDKGPEWQHVTVIEEPKQPGGNSRVKCAHCDLLFWASGTRIKAHFLGYSVVGVRACTACPQELTDQLKDLENKKKEEQTKKRKVTELDQATKAVPTSVAGQSSLQAAFCRQDKSQVDCLWARAFYANGLSFRLAANSHFKAAVEASCQFGPSYKPPSVKALRTTLLQKEKEALDEELQSYKEGLSLSKGTVTSDGWSDTRNRPLLNVLLVSPKGEKFIKAVDTSGETKDAAHIAGKICEAIEEIGPEHICQVITDSAASCKAAGRIIEERYPHITWTPCTPHCLDLLLEDFGKLDWVSTVIADAKTVLKFITNHHKSLALFRSLSELELLKPGDTRFATVFIMLERMQTVKAALQQLVVSVDWAQWNERSSHEAEGDEVKDIILRNSFWKSIKEILAASEASVVLLRQCDKGIPMIGKIYYGMYLVGQELAALKDGTLEGHEGVRISAAKFDQLHSSWEKRWNMLHSDMHSAGFVLDPEFQHADYGQATNAEVNTGFLNILEKFLPDVQDQVKALAQLAKYRNFEGIFGRPVVMESAKSLPAWKFWLQFGSECPELQRVAVPVLSQVSCASACERNWSTYDFIHSKKRNRLAHDRAADLVRVFSDLRLAEKLNHVAYEEQMIAWIEDDVVSEEEGD